MFRFYFAWLCLPLFFSPAPALAAEAAPPRRVEVVFALDTTGSMAGLIEGAKKKIWSIANTIVDQYPGAEISFGLVGYRDLGDEYVTAHFPLTTDAQAVYARLLRFQAAGGGDTPESVNEALDVAVTKLGWTDGGRVKADRVLFLVGDAPPHLDYEQDRKYPEIIAEAAQKGIIVNTVQCGDMGSTRKIWQEMARLGQGEYLSIPQDGGRVRVIETPYDHDILIIQRRLNLTVIPYGSSARQSAVKEKVGLYEAPAAAAPARADMSAYVSKSTKGKGVVTGGGDLVEDAGAGRVELEALPQNELPAEMQPMSPDERAAYVKGKADEREALSKNLAELTQRRDAYVREREQAAPAQPADSFDAGVKNTLRKQMKP